MYAHDGTTPLIVDVDGTLVSGDLLIEGIARLLAVSPLHLLVLPFWFAEGRAALKRRIAQAVPLSPKTLTFNPSVLNEIAVARAAGREVWLASAADELVVAQIAENLGGGGGGNRLFCLGRKTQPDWRSQGRRPGQALRAWPLRLYR